MSDKDYTTEAEIAELFTAIDEQDTDAPTTEADTADDGDTTGLDNDATDTADTDTDTADDDATDTDGDTADDTDEADYIVEVDGTKYTEQQLKDLHADGLRFSDYTKKTQALAEDRKAWEAQKQTELAESQKKLDDLYESTYNNAKSFIDGAKLSETELADLASRDPYGYQEYVAKQDVAKRIVQANQEKLEATRKEQADKAVETLAGLSDNFKNDFEKTYNETMDYMVKMGMPQEAVLNETNPYVIKAFHDSMVLNNNRGNVGNKVKILGKDTESSPLSEDAKANKARKELIKNASTQDDLAAIFEQFG